MCLQMPDAATCRYFLLLFLKIINTVITFCYSYNIFDLNALFLAY